MELTDIVLDGKALLNRVLNCMNMNWIYVEEMRLISPPVLNPSSVILTLVIFKLWRLDMKIVTRDVKNIFCFDRVCVVMGSGLFRPCFVLQYKNILKNFSYPRCNRQE